MKPLFSIPIQGDSDSDDSMDWEMTESSSSSSNPEEGTGTSYHYTAAYFLKRYVPTTACMLAYKAPRVVS